MQPGTRIAMWSARPGSERVDRILRDPETALHAGRAIGAMRNLGYVIGHFFLQVA
jgi:hypothetical protein